MRVMVYDLEIITSPMEHPDGWEGARRGECGVSCVAVWDSLSKFIFLFNEYDLDECVNFLNEADLLVSFNGIEFDTPCLEGVTDRTIRPPQYDILREIWRALPHRKKGFRLGEVAERMGLGGKTSEGARATDMYREGDFTRLYSYCRNDVALTQRLASWINTHGFILTPDGEELPLERPGAEI